MKHVHKMKPDTEVLSRSQRGSTLWTSSTEIRASKQTRNACLTMPIASKPKPGILEGVLTLKPLTLPWLSFSRWHNGW